MPDHHGAARRAADGDARTRLDALGIQLRHHRPGEHRAACPRCAKDKHDTALSVKVGADGNAVWKCWRCDWNGTTRRRAPPSSWRSPRRLPPGPDPAALAELQRKREQALETWRGTETISTGLPLRYLTERRGITTWNADRLRWAPACPWGAGTTGCIVAPVVSHATGHTVAIWRIRPVMVGKVRRLGLGPVKGNAARLFEPEGDELAVAEGVEDAVTLHALIGLPTWAALSAGNMKVLILPRRFRRVVIVPDNDPPNEKTGISQGIDAAQVLARRLRAEGRAVEILKPKNAKDANDVLMRRNVA